MAYNAEVDECDDESSVGASESDGQGEDSVVEETEEDEEDEEGDEFLDQLTDEITKDFLGEYGRLPSEQELMAILGIFLFSSSNYRILTNAIIMLEVIRANEPKSSPECASGKF